MTLNTRIFEWYTHDIPFGVMFIDIDNFKNVNDTYGHKTGDDVLIMVANSISHSLRKMDVPTRWGGEEFVVILPGASIVVLKAAAERIRMLIEKSYLVLAEDKLTVTVSIGAAMSIADDTVEEIVSRADKLMYLSKNRGRNQVTTEWS
jgi:diguanylate cyclase (GGDEF)-like protein